MFKRLRIRLTVVCAISTGLVLIGMALVSLHISSKELSKQYEQRFLSDIGGIFFYLRGQNSLDHGWLTHAERSGGLWISATYNSVTIENNVRELHSRPLLFGSLHPTRARLTGLAAQAAADYDFDYTLAPSGTLQPDVITFQTELDGISYRMAAASVPLEQTRWVSVAIAQDRTEELARLRSLRRNFALCVILALGCLVAFAWFFIAWVIRPVRESHRRQAEFISAASHELRSPLAVMQASAGAAKYAPAEDARAFAETIERECKRLARLTDDLLRLAAAGAGKWSIQMTSCDPQTLLLTVGERSEVLARRNRIALVVTLPEEELPEIQCDVMRIEQLLDILLDNAVSYTPQGGKIRLSAKMVQGELYVSVEDSGPGVPVGERERIFLPFERADRARADKEHYGLGLSLAQEIAKLHKGSLTVSDSALGGALFSLHIPG